MPRARQTTDGVVTDACNLTDPGHVEGNVVFAFLDAFDPHVHAVEEIKRHDQRGGLGDMVLKRRLNELLQAVIAPMRERRKRFADDRGEVLAQLKRGTETARERAARTVSDVKSALGLSYF